MRPYLHTNGDALSRSAELREAVQRVYEYIVVGIYDYETNAELERTKDRWRDLLAGADVRFSAIGRQGILTADSMGVPKALVPTDPRMAIPDLVYLGAPCHRPAIRLIIQYDGTVCNCCEDTRGVFELGNVYERTIEEVWYSEHHVRVVEDLIEGRRERYGLCRGCPLPPTAPAPPGKRLAIAPRRHPPAATGRVVEADPPAASLSDPAVPPLRGPASPAPA